MIMERLNENICRIEKSSLSFKKSAAVKFRPPRDHSPL